MRAKSFIFVLLLSMPFLCYAQEKKTVRSTLKEAVVFFRGAELTHTATVKLNKGENEVYIEGLSPKIDKNSLKIKASNGTLITSYEFTVDYMTEKSVDAATQKIKDSITYYERKLEQNNIDLNVSTNLIALLQKGTEKNVSGSESGLGIDELVKTMDYYRSKSKELQDAQVKYNRTKTELTQSIDRLKKQLQQEELKNSKEGGLLKITLTSPLITESTFSVSYFTSFAGWQPYYDINVVSTDKPVNILMKSKVYQTTGLDWDRVKLTLSTSVPSNGKVAPLFSTWFLNYYAPPRLAEPALNSVSYKMSASQTAYSYDKEMAEIQKDEMVESTLDDYIIKSDNELAVTYNIDIPYTIPGNGKEQQIDLFKKEINAEYKYYCAPKLNVETYLLAEIADWQKLDLLSGKANVTYDGTYIGETYIDANSTLEKLALTLGVDKRVTVKRELMGDYSSAKFIGSDVRQIFTYKLTVRNSQNKPIKMVLKDQYPKSTQKEITVELLMDNTTPFSFNKEDVGVITWEEEFKAGETKEYKISYSIKYPKGKKLNF